MKQLDVHLMHPVEQINIIIGRIYHRNDNHREMSPSETITAIYGLLPGVDKGNLTTKDIMCVKRWYHHRPHKPSSEYPFHKATYETENQSRNLLIRPHWLL